MKGSKHLYTPVCTAILVFTGFLAQPRSLDRRNRHRVNLMALFLCSYLSVND